MTSTVDSSSARAATGARQLRRVAVFCGSNHGTDPAYAEAARELARCLLDRQAGLVYGGGNVGLMGVVADAVLDGGGEVLGVIPRSLVDREVAHDGLTDLVVVETMHQRKQRMYDLADAVIAMPGGIGTLDELFEAWTWNQLGYLDQPYGVLNVGGYFDPLLEMLQRMVDRQFLGQATLAALQVADDPDRLLEKLAAVRPVSEEKWIRGGPRADS